MKISFQIIAFYTSLLLGPLLSCFLEFLRTWSTMAFRQPQRSLATWRSNRPQARSSQVVVRVAANTGFSQI